MDEKELKISYDPKGDVLYCSFGDPREAISIEQEGMIIRLDPETEDVIGVTVVDFSKRFREHPGNILKFPAKNAFHTPQSSHCAK